MGPDSGRTICRRDETVKYNGTDFHDRTGDDQYFPLSGTAGTAYIFSLGGT